ncbi:MAG: hypothetical protein COY66_01400 [Candidatus Kerfeldbacteria bacterium CG_4_10_14_0_8_um_filter_42_10]|uniref:Uncharacterized protein n=1 Tax=Candidatus Kerfeldbacteria bacterium CG_4_10_14_0_8_um_filter_42_10 TaxID=2014248 RepID=A0A2M7RKL7_9BACT|nr:MAG: hypothetical protein COY66_01400 [Candidatus Kerfeldbacteria bacterium CG_4_10_14_0_8_um_filter_42_10]
MYEKIQRKADPPRAEIPANGSRSNRVNVATPYLRVDTKVVKWGSNCSAKGRIRLGRKIYWLTPS